MSSQVENHECADPGPRGSVCRWPLQACFAVAPGPASRDFPSVAPVKSPTLRRPRQVLAQKKGPLFLLLGTFQEALDT